MSPREPLPPRAAAASALVVNGVLALAFVALASLDVAPELVPRLFAYGFAAFAASRALWRLAARGAGTMGAASYVKAAGAAALLAFTVSALVDPLPLTASPFAFLALATGALSAARKLDGRAARHVSSALGIALLAASALAARPLAAALPDGWRVWVVASASAAAALAPRIASRAPPAVRRALGSEARAVGLATPLAIYVVYRPFLGDAIEHFELYEWTLGLALGGFVVSAALNAWKESAVADATTSAARVQEPTVRPIPGEELASLAGAFRAWVDHGEERGGYVAAWRRHGLDVEPPDVDASREVRERDHLRARSRFLDGRRRAMETRK